MRYVATATCRLRAYIAKFARLPLCGTLRLYIACYNRLHRAAFYPLPTLVPAGALPAILTLRRPPYRLAACVGMEKNSLLLCLHSITYLEHIALHFLQRCIT